MNANPYTRYSFLKSNTISSNQIHLRSPLIVAWWSLAFPGFGHFLVNSYLWGFILMSFEYIINSHCHINLSIYYSMIGEFEQAKDVIELRFFFLYIVVYIFAVWDSYRRSVENNKVYQLARKEINHIEPASFSAFEFNLLERKQPWTAIVWSLLMPGVGYIYMQQIWSFLFSLFWWVIILYYSHFLEGFYFTMVGDMSSARGILNPQWALFLPSIYGFVFYNTYEWAVENNKLYKVAQASHFRSEYQHLKLDYLYKKGAT